MRIAVTGGSGAIGADVCGQLLDAGHDVVCVDLVAPAFSCEHVVADLCELGAACAALKDVDQIIHLAAIPNPFSDPPERLMAVNMPLSFNVFEAARLNGISRVIYGCSESSSGYGIHSVAHRPLYVPIDEEHPCRPHETYSLTKYFGELIGLNYADAFGLEVLSLRYMWVWMGRSYEPGAGIVARSRAGELGENPWFGAHIARRDVASACLRAVAFEFPPGGVPFEAFYLAAKNTFYPVPTLDVLRRIYGDLPEVRDPGYFQDNPFATVFDIRKADRMLGWQPECDWRDFENWPE